jgi:aspartyl-tRNA synthetase
MNRIYCGHVTEKLLDETIALSGWVATRRDHGGIIFIDLRDYTGLVQLIFDPEDKELFANAESLRSEYVIQVSGKVRNRFEGTINNDLVTGKIELIVSNLIILNKSKTPPFKINDLEINEDQRLQYRYLDIRSENMQRNLRFRSKLINLIRDFFNSENFIDIETPILTKTTPEGARDYLVPSRIHANHFFALPQSPQLFKQTLMIGGIDKYFQIAKCFRDEDLRSDRQPEFTQLDVEVSFADEESVMSITERLFTRIFKEILNYNDMIKFNRITYLESLNKYGCDKPDLRNPLALHDIKDIVKDVEFKVFLDHVTKKDSRIVALKIPNGCDLSRKDIDDYTELVKRFGAKGLAYIKCENISNIEDGVTSPIKKFLTNDVLQSIINKVDAKNNDLIFFSADNNKVVNDSMSVLIKEIGVNLGLLQGEWSLLWVTDYPLFELDTKTKQITSIHHPFTSPKNPDDLNGDPLSVSSRAYDFIINGNEIGGGSIRIHSKDVQIKIFKLLGINDEEMNAKFGFFLNALSYGCPPHGGIAFGIDRLAMILLQLDSIREIIAFPKTQSTACLMTEAPSEANNQQLAELSIKTIKNK